MIVLSDNLLDAESHEKVTEILSRLNPLLVTLTDEQTPASVVQSNIDTIDPIWRELIEAIGSATFPITFPALLAQRIPTIVKMVQARSHVGIKRCAAVLGFFRENTSNRVVRKISPKIGMLSTAYQAFDEYLVVSSEYLDLSIEFMEIMGEKLLEYNALNESIQAASQTIMLKISADEDYTGDGASEGEVQTSVVEMMATACGKEVEGDDCCGDDPQECPKESPAV